MAVGYPNTIIMLLGYRYAKMLSERYEDICNGIRDMGYTGMMLYYYYYYYTNVENNTQKALRARMSNATREYMALVIFQHRHDYKSDTAVVG